ncbi:hypothetical protein [Pyrolobus fumarii]|uniref:hypothetical protein n=1 Tax=Pyrolobus fumarii TaxID=54252 RepID=UPI0031345BAF
MNGRTIVAGKDGFSAAGIIASKARLSLHGVHATRNYNPVRYPQTPDVEIDEPISVLLGEVVHTTVTIRIPRSMVKRLAREAEKLGVTLEEYILDLLSSDTDPPERAREYARLHKRS